MFAFSDRRWPACFDAIRARAAALGFKASSDERTGRLLAWLASGYPAGRFLDFGTGAGISAAWLLMGMDARARLVSIDNDESAQAIAREFLGLDERAAFILKDGAAFLETADPKTFDLIFADAWPGKFSELDGMLKLLRPNGVYVVDDLFPQPNWPDNHQPNVDGLVATLEALPNFDCIRLDWSTGLVLARRLA